MRDFKLTWDAEVGMCRQNAPGHTKEVSELTHVHIGSSTSAFLCLLAQHGVLKPEDALITLRSFRKMQVLEEGPRFGCLNSYLEEQGTADTNASFFIGLSLQLLYLAEWVKLGEAVKAAIREILNDLSVWFEHELTSADGNPRYPNKCLGDLVCGWLNAEILDRPASETLLRTTLKWCDYWHREHWGWGEHMSDAYTMILLTELSAALLFCPRLPTAVRHEFQRHFNNLMSLNDSYGAGPRVPSIRCYGFKEAPTCYPFRSYILAKPAGEEEAKTKTPSAQSVSRIYPAVFGPWFHRAGWGELDAGVKPVKSWVEVPCRDNAVARAVVHPNIRIGAMSHYPIMEGVDHQTWGLSWQTFPAALWRPAGDWAFWRWTTKEGDRFRSHPATTKWVAYLGNALSTKINPPPIPQMKSKLSREGEFSMERSLPVPAAADWDEVSDAFFVLGSNAVVTADDSQLILQWPDCTVRVKFLGETIPEWRPKDGGGQWEVRYDRESLLGSDSITHYWELTLEQR